MKYAILTNHGFLMRDDIEAATYDTAEEAMKHMVPGYQIVPISEESYLCKKINAGSADES